MNGCNFPTSSRALINPLLDWIKFLICPLTIENISVTSSLRAGRSSEWTWNSSTSNWQISECARKNISLQKLTNLVDSVVLAETGIGCPLGNRAHVSVIAMMSRVDLPSPWTFGVDNGGDLHIFVRQWDPRHCLHDIHFSVCLGFIGVGHSWRPTM